MDASTVVAICAVVIAVGSLVVSVSEAQATRNHYRRSVRPLLQLDIPLHPGRRSGLQLINAGLGPAVITKTVLMVDGEELDGGFNESNVNTVRDALPFQPRPSAVTFGGKVFLAADYSQFLLSVASFDRDEHAEFEDLLRRRLTLEIRYESLYESRDRGKSYKAVWKPHPDQPPPHPRDTP